MFNFASYNLRSWVNLTTIILLALVPVLVSLTGNEFFLDIATRLVILAMAAVTLNLILGYGGLISFGHAGYLGIGAYAVGIPVYHEVYNGFIHFSIAVVGSALFALITGMISLRTKGVHFIMITMAFSQMAFFGFVSMEEYGGDDGLVIEARSEVGGLIDLENNTTLYYFCFIALLLTIYVVHRLVNSRFGMVIKGAKGNERRLQSLGFNTYRYRLACYVLAGAICGFAGALLGNFTSFISPEMMDWSRSGELIFMVVLGGTATLFGPLLGTTAFLLLEEYLPHVIDLVVKGGGLYWQLAFGLILILVVLYMKGGINGFLSRREGKK